MSSRRRGEKIIEGYSLFNDSMDWYRETSDMDVKKAIRDTMTEVYSPFHVFIFNR